MEDIKKAIEEEIDRYLYETDGWTTKRCSMEYISNLILSKWQEATIWRKVEEELPEDNARVLVKSKAGRYYLSCYSKANGFSSNANIIECKYYRVEAHPLT